MIIKKFQAKTESEAIEAARKELGANVVVMNVRNVKKKGIFAIFSPQLVEVTVALEDDTDQLQIVLRREMLAIEHQYSPIDIMVLYKIVESVGVLADQAQRIGSRIELMLARS